MSYIDGFVIPCPKDRKQAFVDHATRTDAMFLELGALRIVECWADDVPNGTLTDFRMAVKTEEHEEVAFSWIEWPDKATRDAAFAKLMDPENNDPRVSMATNPPPFDGKRMIFGGFVPLVDLKK
ncbi:MAG: DUF1428 domain-containing protein [Novosphingobium sp.]